MDSPITTECEALRQEVELLRADNLRMANALKVPAYPEKAVRAVWEHGQRHGWDAYRRGSFVSYQPHAEEVGRIFVKALRDA